MGSYKLNMTGEEVQEALNKAASGGGGGSTSKYAQPDWGFDENGVILPETSLELVPDMGGFIVYTWGEQYLEHGKTYTVNYNGVPYECPCTYFSMEGTDGYILGNGTAIGLDVPASDAPFVLMLNSPLDTSVMGFAAIVAPLDGSESCTISIMGEVVHKLPAEYVAGGGGIYIATLSVINFNDKTCGFFASFEEVYKAITSGKQVFAYDPTDGQYYSVASFEFSCITFVRYDFVGGGSIFAQMQMIKYNNDGTGAIDTYSLKK